VPSAALEYAHGLTRVDAQHCPRDQRHVAAVFAGYLESRGLERLQTRQRSDRIVHSMSPRQHGLSSVVDISSYAG
jgi:hypothetical protein